MNWKRFAKLPNGARKARPGTTSRPPLSRAPSGPPGRTGRLAPVLLAASLATACAPSTGFDPVAVRPRLDPIDAGLSQTPARPRQWPAEAALLPEAVVTYRWSADRTTANACVDRFVAYRDSVEERDARVRGDAPE